MIIEDKKDASLLRCLDGGLMMDTIFAYQLSFRRMQLNVIKFPSISVAHFLLPYPRRVSRLGCIPHL